MPVAGPARTLASSRTRRPWSRGVAGDGGTDDLLRARGAGPPSVLSWRRSIALRRGLMRQVAHCYVVVEARVLLLERPPGLRGAGFWAPPGGHLEAGESPVEAACRECAEELGLALAPEQLTLLRRAPFRERTGSGVNWLFTVTLAAPPPFFPAA